MYSVISVIVDSLLGNTKNRESTRSWTDRVRLVHSWAGYIEHTYIWHLDAYQLHISHVHVLHTTHLHMLHTTHLHVTSHTQINTGTCKSKYHTLTYDKNDSWILSVTAYCIWRVVSPISDLNECSSSLGLFCRSLLPRSVEKRPWRLRLEIKIEWHSKCIWLFEWADF